MHASDAKLSQLASESMEYESSRCALVKWRATSARPYQKPPRCNQHGNAQLLHGRGDGRGGKGPGALSELRERAFSKRGERLSSE